LKVVFVRLRSGAAAALKLGADAHCGASEWHEWTVCIFEKAHAQVAEDEEANDGTADQGAECRITLVLAHAVAWSGLTPATNLLG